MLFKRIAFLVATVGLAAGMAHADPAADAAATQPSEITVDSPGSLTTVNTATPVVAALPASPAVVERDEFLQQSSAIILNAQQVAGKIDANLKAGTLHGYERKDLENLQNRISEAEAMSLKYQRASVDSLVNDRKSAEKAMDELAAAYFPAAGLTEEARVTEETQVQAQIAQLEQHKSTLQATAGSTKLSSALKGAVKEAEDKLEASIKATQKTLGKLQAAKDNRWASLRKDTQDAYEKSDDAFHEAIERITRPS